MTNTLQVGKRYRFYNHENVGYYQTAVIESEPLPNTGVLFAAGTTTLFVRKVKHAIQ